MSKVEINKYLSERLIRRSSHLPKCTLPILFELFFYFFLITFLNDRAYITNLDSKLKSRDITLPTKVCL